MRFVPLSPEYFDQYAELFLRNKGELRAHHTPQGLSWAYINYPLARETGPVMELACDGDEVVGCMGILPQILLDGRNEIPVALLIDLLVDSRHRGKKIGSALVQRALERYPVAVVLGGTPASYSLIRSLGMVDHGITVTVRRVFHPWRWAQGSGRGNLFARVGWTGVAYARHLRQPECSDCDRLETEFVSPEVIGEELVSSSNQLAQTHICTLRNAARWEWLVNESPLYKGHTCKVSRGGTVLGYAALVIATRSRRKVGTIADISVASIQEAAPVVGAAAQSLERLGVDGVDLKVSKPVAEALIGRYGFEELSSSPITIQVREEFEYLLTRPWFATMAENLAIINGIDLPIGANRDRDA